MHKSDDWGWLVGLQVELRRGGAKIRTGTVEHAMADHSALWLAAEGMEPRTLIPAGEGYEIWVEQQVNLASAFRRTPEVATRYKEVWTNY